jgi:predicted phosphodiesterase
MRALILSDLHHEFGARVDAPHVGMDCVILAGDVDVGDRGLRWADTYFEPTLPIFYVLGNHEYYGGDLVRNVASGQYSDRMHVLDRGMRQIGDTAFIGATLWTDFALNEPSQSTLHAMQSALAGLSDYRAIQCAGGPLSPAQILGQHHRDLAYLRAMLERVRTDSAVKRIVVITHHAPLAACVDDQYADSPLNPCFASRLDTLVEQADVWIHGHTHASVELFHGQCQVVANPAGYPRRDGERENRSFNPAKIIDL